MTPIELLASQWIWYAVFGVVAILFFLRARRRTAPSFPQSSPASRFSRDRAPAPEGDRSGHPPRARSGGGETAPAHDDHPSHAPAHAGHEGHGGHGGHGARRHGCC